MSTNWPERIWLLPGTGEDGTATWCDDPNPGVGMKPEDAIEYVRADAVPKWQDISTAPKDGRSILLRYKDCIFTAGWFGNADEGEKDGLDWWDGRFFHRATHWMPLPQPPKDGE